MFAHRSSVDREMLHKKKSDSESIGANVSDISTFIFITVVKFMECRHCYKDQIGHELFSIDLILSGVVKRCDFFCSLLSSFVQGIEHFIR